MTTAHQKFKNNSASTLNGTLSIGGVTINLAVGTGTRFPTLSAGEYFYATLYEKDGSANEINYEIVKCTSITSDTLTVVRDIEGLVVAAGGTSGGWAYPSAPGVNPSQVVHVELRHTAYAANNNLAKDGNLEELESAATARTNLGLGSMSTQNASAVAITGGTISGVTLTDSSTLFADNADNTKKMQFELSSIGTGLTRTITVPNNDITLPGTNIANTWAADQTFSGKLNKVTITPPTTSATITLADGKTLTANDSTTLGTNSITFAGTELLTLAAAKNVTFADAFATAGAHSVTLTSTADTNVTLPTTGTLATLAGAEALTNKTINGNTITAGTGVLTLAAGKTLSALKTLTLDGTDGTTMTFPATNATLARTDAANTFTGHQTIEGVTATGATGTGKMVFDTSPVLVTPALGTPASGVATNLTGTAAGLTAGNVTTNANLTGPITSAGNATAVASQTGTGSKFVMDTSPTLVTPNIGAATGTSLNLGSGAITAGATGVTTLNASSTTNLAYGLFRKADPTTAAFVKTGAFTISTQAAAISVEVNGVVHAIAASTAVTMPGSPASGTDYAIWAKTDGTLEATSNHVTPPTANARRIGGFHYAPGGNATGVAGGDTTPAINAYSIWDLKWRPACADPRGMTLVAGGFWSDIYLLGVDHPTNGSSKYNVTIADGSSPPKIPAAFGGNGSTAYGGGNWWDMGEALRSFGKRHPTYDEFAALAYGTTEAASATAATDPVSTILRAESTSKWGVMLSTGNLYVWGANLGGPYNTTAAWQNDTGGRGQTYNLPNAVLLGGTWGDGVHSGSRASNWSGAPSNSNYYFGARGVCDHLQLD